MPAMVIHGYTKNYTYIATKQTIEGVSWKLQWLFYIQSTELQ